MEQQLWNASLCRPGPCRQMLWNQLFFRVFSSRDYWKIETGRSLDGKDPAVPARRWLLLMRESCKEELYRCQCMKHWWVRMWKGKEMEKLKASFWYKNKCLWTDQKYTHTAAQMVSINGALVLWVRLPGRKRDLTGFRRAPYDIGCGSGRLHTCTQWNSFQTWQLTNTLFCASSAAASELRRSCMREAANGCTVLVWRVARQLYMRTGMNYNKH